MNNRNLLMIPGPIEFDPEVLQAMSTKTPSHVAPHFIESFGACLDMMQEIWQAPNGQAFIVPGSGTLAMDMAATNLTEPGDKVLIVSSGYFGERFQDIFDRYGADTTLLSAPIGETPAIEAVEQELKKNSYKILAFTHVDTSTGVKANAKEMGRLAKQYGVLSILDGVCSVAGEEIAQEEWGLDIVLTASQKAIGVPPGLALLVASQKAMEIWKNRKSAVANYYGDFANWLPIMQAYQERQASYFGTPAVNLVLALELSLKQIKAERLKIRFERHKKLAKHFRESLQDFGFQLVVKNTKDAANTLTAAYYPKGIDGAAFRKKLSAHHIIVAGGLLAAIKTSYFRVGHMGAVTENDIVATLNAIKKAL